MQDFARRTAVRAQFRTRIGSALLAVPLVVALTATPALAAAGPRLVLSPARGASGTVITMTLTNCSDPRLWTEPTDVGASGAADAGSAGYVYWTSEGKGPFSYGFEFAGTWVGGGTTWTASFTANLASGKDYVFVYCAYRLVNAIFTVR